MTNLDVIERLMEALDCAREQLVKDCHGDELYRILLIIDEALKYAVKRQMVG